MKPVIKDIREITDSKEMYEMMPHPFLSIFIYMVLVGIIGAGMWAYFGEIDIVSKGVGVVRPNESMSRIRNKVQGEVIQSFLEEGKQVQVGDTLFTIGYEELKIKQTQAVEVLKETEEELYLLKKMRDSVEKGENLFSKEIEKEYYERFIKYEQDYESLLYSNTVSNKTDTISTTQTQINQKIYEDKLEVYATQMKGLEDYKHSIENEKNLFEDKTCALSLEFNTYLFQLHELNNSLKDKRMAYELNVLLDKEGMVAKKVLEDSKIAVQDIENELLKLKLGKLASINEKLQELEIARAVAVQEQSKLIVDDGLLHTHEVQRSLALKQYKTDMLVSLYNQIDEKAIQYETRQREVEAIQLAISDCQVTAPISGTLHIIQKVNKGDLIGAGIDIATIIPTNDSMYKVEIFMPNRDIAGIEEGDTIKYKFDALPYKEYGHLEGKITNISADAKVNDTQGISGYVVEGSIQNATVYSYKDKPAQIKVGMTCEAHVVTAQKKILYYLLEKINLRD